MATRTLSTALIAIALVAPAAGAFADQPFGRDSVYAAGTTSRSAETSGATARNEAQPNGRDTVSAARIPGNGQPRTSTAEFVLRPGRA